MNVKKIILMILNQRFLPDPRVKQEYDEFVKAGYRVVVVANMDGHEQKGYEIVRINPKVGIFNKINLTLKRNRKLENNIINGLKAIGVENVDAIHVHDLAWSFLGIRLKKVFNAKLVIDLHENYPALIADLRNEEMFKKSKTCKEIIQDCLKDPFNGPVWHLIRRYLYSPKNLKKYELEMLSACDRFIVVVDEALDRFKSESFYSKGVIVSNTKNPEVWSYEPVSPITDKLVLTYMGTIQDLRGLDTAILAMLHLDQEKFELNIVGIQLDSPIHMRFVDIIRQNSIKNVNLIEWISDEKEAFSYINRAHVGIVPHKDTELTQTTVPHKLFMYMAIGRPVLVSDVAPLKRIVTTSKNGLVFKAEDPRDLALKMQEISNSVTLAQFSTNGRNAVLGKFNWIHDKDALLGLYDELLN